MHMLEGNPGRLETRVPAGATDGSAPLARRGGAAAKHLARQIYHTSRDSAWLYRLAMYQAGRERAFRRRSLAELEAAQWRKFERLLRFADDHVPFYRDRFREAGVRPEAIRTREDLARIPPLTKDDIRRNFPDRLVREGRTYPPHQLGRSSGSTGESVHFVRPDATWPRSLSYAVLLRMRGIRNVPIFVLTTPTCTPNSCSLEYDDPDNAFTNALLQIPPLRHLAGMIGLPAWLPNILVAPDAYMEALRARIAAYPPSVIVADPVYLGAFARYLRRTGQRAPRLRVIVTSYELLTGSLRDLLTEVFGCEVYTQYGASELTDIANQCEEGRLHVRMDMVLFEAVRDGRPARPGELARVLVTDLDNFNMPFIRYDLGDVVRLADGECPCGRRTQAIAAIEGRIADTVTAGGRVFTALEVDEIFRRIPGLAAHRLIQEAADRYRVSLMREPGAAPDTDLALRRCRSALGERSRFQIDVVDEITPEASNKFCFLRSRLGPARL